MSVDDARQERVLEYLRAMGGATSREIAEQCLGADGSARGSARSVAHRVLGKLQAAGRARVAATWVRSCSGPTKLWVAQGGG